MKTQQLCETLAAALRSAAGSEFVAVRALDLAAVLAELAKPAPTTAPAPAQPEQTPRRRGDR